MSSQRKPARSERGLVVSHGGTCCCETLKKENASLKSELEKLRCDYSQLIKETSVENFSQRRVNLLKAHVLQLERQILILSDALDGQVRLLSDLQVYGEGLEHKIKSGEPVGEDVTRLRKLNQRLKKVPCSKEDLSLPLVYTGRYSKSLSILDSLSNRDNISFRETSWLEGELSKLHCHLRGLHTCLSLLPKRLEVPTLKQVDPVYNLLERLGGEVSGTLDLLSSVSQELMNFTLTIPGQAPYRCTSPHVTDTEMVRKEILSMRDKKMLKGQGLLEMVLRTLETIKGRQADQLKAQDEEISRQRENMEEYVKYLEELFVSIKKSHKEFLTDLYHKIDLPLKDLTTQYYLLKASNSSLEILESYIYELSDVARELNQVLMENESESAADLLQKVHKLL